MGMKDQVEALRWVQRNIAVFGGDPDEVTIGGQSAGGASVSYLVLSPLTAGLFKRAIAHSGAAINPWAFSRNATDRAARFAEYLGYSAQSSEDLYNFYMTVNISDLVRDKAKALSPEDRKSLFKCTWVPSAEPEHEGAFLAEEPWVLVSEGRYNYVPYLTGHTDLEMLSKTQPDGTLATEDKISSLNEDFEEYVGCDLRLPTREEQLEAASKVREFYYGDEEITLETNYTTAVMVSDLEFVEGVHRVLESMVKYTSLPVYYYQFTYVGTLSDYPDGPGAAHADDTAYLFANSDLDEAEPEGAFLRDQMTEMWANFVRNSLPTPEITSSLTQNWTQYTFENTAYLGIDRPLSTGTGLNQERMSFWSNLLP